MPDSPRCVRCGHEPCPYCEDWCDTLVPDEEWGLKLCCDGACTWDWPDEDVTQWCASAREPTVEERNAHARESTKERA